MSRRMIRVLLSLVMILAVTVSVWADDSAHYTGKENWVTYTKAGELESNFATGSYEENIEGLLPGDDITFTVTLKNENEASTDWYMSNDVIKSLEDGADAANGGAYEYELTYVDPDGNEDVKFSSETVGGEVAGKDGEGLHEATGALKDMFYLGEIAPGKSGQVKLKIALDGESQGNGYQKTLAGLKMNFAVEDKNSEVVKTGDKTNLMLYAGLMLVSGVALMMIAWVQLRKRARGKKVPE